MHFEAWHKWVEGKPGRFVLRRPTNIRHSLSWKELKVVLGRVMCVLDVLDDAAPEHQQTAREAKKVLTRLHKRWAPVTKCLKQLHFEPTDEFDNPVSNGP